MEPKSELLVFSKREVTVIIVLLVLVALFSFTLGLRLGRSLGSPHASEQAETVPLVEKQAEAPKTAEETAKPEEHAAAEKSEVKPEEAAKPQAKEAPEATAGQQAEDHADTELNKEIAKTKVGLSKPVPMALPSEKKADISEGVRYTLQVGSHRTVAEAAEQVSALKHGNLEAFYLEAKVPGRGTWYRVGVGVYATKEQAERAGARLRGENRGLPSFLVQKINE